MPIQVEQITSVTEELVAAFNRLLPQLSSSGASLSVQDLHDMVKCPCVILFAARDTDDQRLIGTLTLVTFRIPTGVRSWVEDVVVDSTARRRGAGEMLTKAAIETAERLGATSLNLTSRAFRESANRLYQRMGFERRDTNVFRLKLPRCNRRYANTTGSP